MAIPLSSLAGHGPTFDEPVEMLAACHERIARQCETLVRLAPHVATHGSDGAAQEAATAVLRYFDTAGVNHHLDEEEDLFPALRRASPGPATAALLDTLVAEHERMLAAWKERIAPPLAAISRGLPATLPAHEVADFAGLYRRHIAREESELLPLARALVPAVLASLGATMAARRGVTPSTGD